MVELAFGFDLPAFGDKLPHSAWQLVRPYLEGRRLLLVIPVARAAPEAKLQQTLDRRLLDRFVAEQEAARSGIEDAAPPFAALNDRAIVVERKISGERSLLPGGGLLLADFEKSLWRDLHFFKA